MKDVTRREALAMVSTAGLIPFAPLLTRNVVAAETEQVPLKHPTIIAELLTRLAPQDGILRIGESLIEISEKDERSRTSLRNIQNWVLNALGDERLAKLPPDTSEVGFPGMATLTSTLYLLALQDIQTKGLPTRKELTRSLEGGLDKLKRFGTESLRELTVAADSLALRSPAFAQRQADATKQIMSLQADLEKQVERWDSLAPKEARAARSGWWLAVDGEIVREISCWLAWLIILGIIIIIILA